MPGPDRLMSSLSDLKVVPPGKLAAVVTTLEMRNSGPHPRRDPPDGIALLRRDTMALDDYRDVFRRVGENWLWFSRLALPDPALAAIIHDPQVEVWSLMHRGRPEGLVELDFRIAGACELAFFGVTDALIGTGIGRWLMQQAITTAWAKPITRFWMHTCTLDHPGALRFYLRSGFAAVGRQVEVVDDPRLIGLLPRDAAPHVPIVEPKLAAESGARGIGEEIQPSAPT